MKQTLWTKNYTLLILATAIGSVGGIAGGFALSFLVFDETGSTLASALILAVQIVPGFVIPLVASPWMDRLPRKPFLVAGDALNGVLYTLAGVYLLRFPFSYVGYLVFSLVLSCLGTFDSLAYGCIYPMLIPSGLEQKGNTVSAMLYPVLRVLMMPVAAWLLEAVGVAWILIFQGGMSVLAAVIESRILLREESRMGGERFSLGLWWRDLLEATAYLKQERGVQSIFTYMGMTNGVAQGYGPMLVAFFRVTPGFTTAMYSLFSVAEFLGRSVGGLLHYRVEIPKHRRFGVTFWVYQIYEAMDMCLLWLPYPLMLVNRALCGFLGVNSATLRVSAVQGYIPDHMRARLNAFQEVMVMGYGCVLTLVMGAMGEWLDYRVNMTLWAALTMVHCWLSVWKHRIAVKKVYEKE